MKLNREKFDIARARACMSQKDFEEAGVPKGTLCRAMGGKNATKNYRKNSTSIKS